MKTLHSVFDHHVAPDTVIRLRAAIIDDILDLRSRGYNPGEITRADMDEKTYEKLRKKYLPLVGHGSFNLTNKRTLANEFIWKWTEATGKYIGCQYWSVKAKQLFDLEVQKLGGWPIATASAEALASKLGKRRFGQGLRPKEVRLAHEHVYPIKDMKSWLSNNGSLSRDEIQQHFERQCVACVLLESEHDRTAGHHENPWFRYKDANIHLAPNPAWSNLQHSLISESSLVDAS